MSPECVTYQALSRRIRSPNAIEKLKSSEYIRKTSSALSRSRGPQRFLAKRRLLWNNSFIRFESVLVVIVQVYTITVMYNEKKGIRNNQSSSQEGSECLRL